VVPRGQKTEEVWRYDRVTKQLDYYKHMTTVFLKTLRQMDN